MYRPVSDGEDDYASEDDQNDTLQTDHYSCSLPIESSYIYRMYHMKHYDAMIAVRHSGSASSWRSAPFDHMNERLLPRRISELAGHSNYARSGSG